MATVNEKLTAIADAIREEIYYGGKLTLDDMATHIPTVAALGYDRGYAEGYTEGRKAQYDEFWDSFQDNGNRTNMRNLFSGQGWNDKTFKPKYSMNPTDANSMFFRSKITDLPAILEAQGVTINFYDNCTSMYGAFGYSDITHVGKIDISKSSNYCNFNGVFEGCTNLVTIDEIKLNSGFAHNITDTTFQNCTSLKNITFTNNIYPSINFKWSPLSKDSIMGKPITNEEYEVLSDAVKNNNVFYLGGVYYYGGIISALSRTTTGKTLTLKKTAVNEAFGIDVDDETTYPEGSEYYTLRHSRDNWTFSYV